MATAWTVILSPLKSLREIPTNWFRVVFCMDSFHPPELLPGCENSTYLIDKNLAFNKIYRFQYWYSIIGDQLTDNDWNEKIIGILLLLISLIIFLPALAYRWSLKSSSIIWLPLIWVIGWKQESVNDANLRLQINLESLRHSAQAKITMIYAFIVIFLFTGLPLLFKGQLINLWENIMPVINGESVGNPISFFIAFQMDAWHWSRLIVAILTLIAFFYADKLLRKRKYIKQAGLDFAPAFLRFITLLRIPLSLFTIACGLYLLISPIDWHQQFQNMQWLPLG